MYTIYNNQNIKLNELLFCKINIRKYIEICLNINIILEYYYKYTYFIITQIYYLYI